MKPDRDRAQRSWVANLLLLFALSVLLVRPAAADTNTAQENAKQGTTDWQITGSNSADTFQLEGYASLTSVNRGGTIQFFVNCRDDSRYTMAIYRMGWYGGTGGRLVAGPFTNLVGTKQTIPTAASGTGLIECRWTNPYTLNIPSPAADTTNNWPSGIYLAKLTGQTTGVQAYIMFVVRDDARASDILFQSSVATFQAYNNWGGKCLYDSGSTGGRASKVSFNRPYAQKMGQGDGAAEFLLGSDGGPPGGWEYCTVRFLEREGYSVTYCTDVDTHENQSLLLSHKTFLSVGHDEYWSQEMRNNVTTARDQGVKLGFFGANACYWQIRYETSPANGAADRTIVCYKGSNGITSAGTADPYATDNDPSNDNQISVRWRDGLAGSTRTARPEEMLIGTMYDFGADSVGGDIIVTDASNWLYANTGLVNGSHISGLLGYECDRMQRSGPSNAVQLAHATYSSGNSINWDGSGAYDMAVYTAPSGASVFSTGTIQWAWGLDDWGAIPNSAGDPPYRPSYWNAAVQQMTRNLLGRANTVPYVDAGGPYFGDPSATITFNGSNSNDSHFAIAGYLWDFGDGSTGTGVAPTHTYANSGRYTVTLTVTNSNGNTNVAKTMANIGQPYSIWDSSTKPYLPVTDDAQAIELGVRFRSVVAGYITGIRFYKGSSNTGTHIGSLWSSSGQLLAQATFTGESSSGWQQVTFSSPVRINANQTYVASYHTNAGNYASDPNYFQFMPYDNNPLFALQDGFDGASGVFKYGTGGFPDQSFGSTNYWVDVVFNANAGPDTTAPTVSSVTPANGSSGVQTSTNVTVTFSEAMDPATITGSNITLADGNGNLVPATVTYDIPSFTATLHPSSALASSTTYTGTVKIGVKDLAGNAMASAYTWTFATVVPNVDGLHIWGDSFTPAVATANDPNAIEVGVKFKADADGFINGIRFYKGAGNTGTHIGSLWTTTGTLLGRATFSNETATGWQQVTFSTPVQITAGTVYVASYHTNTGGYSYTSAYFATSGYDNAPLHALSNAAANGNGVYLYGAGGFPNQTYNSNNFWVDVVYNPNASTDTTPPTVISVLPANGATGVSLTSDVKVTFSEAMDPATINGTTITLVKSGGGAVAGTVTYDSNSLTATLHPTSALSSASTYTATVSTGVKDVAGNTMAAPYSWSFSTGVQNGFNIWGDSFTPAVASANDSSPIELGVKFRADVTGYINGIRFYKGAGNTGTHIGSLWTSTGALLGQATFTNESASGWQQVIFSTPVQITAGTTYVASYHTNVGGYSYTSAYFANGGYDNPPLHALSNLEANGNGVYLYGAGGFPNQSYNATNYWVDVVYTPSDTTPPTVVSTNPTSGATAVPLNSTVSATFSKAMDPSTLNGSTFTLTGGSGAVTAAVAYDSTSKTATLTPSSALAASTTYTATITTGAKDVVGNAMASAYTWTFTTAAAPAVSIWGSGATPAVVTANDPSAIEVGVKFTADSDGYIKGIRFYKGAGNTGVHIGSLWSSTGSLLGQATFNRETASGWQQVTFSTPVHITAGTTYVASYHMTNGGYSYTSAYFANGGFDNAPLHALSNAAANGNGVYLYGAGGFPNQSYNSTNYWVDVLFSTSP